MKLYNSLILAILLLLPHQKTQSMEVAATIAYTGQATALYDVITIAGAATATLFGYEIASKHFREKNPNLIDHKKPTEKFDLESLRQAISSLRGQAKDPELFKVAIEDGGLLGAHSYLKSIAKHTPKNKNLPPRKNQNSNRPKKNQNSSDPKPNPISDKLPLVAEGVRQVIENEQEIETIAEEVIHTVTNLTPNSTVNNIYCTQKDISEIANVIIEYCGKVIRHDALHHGGTLKNGGQSGFHFARNLDKLMDKKLIDVNFLAEKSYQLVDKFRQINWRPVGPGFENAKYKMSTVFTGTIEEYTELLKQAIAKIDWAWVQQEALKKGNQPFTFEVKLTDTLSFIFKDFNFNKGTLYSIYPYLTKLCIAAGTMLLGSNTEASQEVATKSIEQDIPSALNSNQNSSEEKKSITTKTKLQPPQITENTSPEEFLAYIASHSEPLDSIKHLIKENLEEASTQSEPAFWEQYKLPTFAQKLKADHEVMKAYENHLKFQCKLNHRFDISYRQEVIEGDKLEPEFDVNDVMQHFMLCHPSSQEAAQIRQYIWDLTETLASTNSTKLAPLQLATNRLKMLFIDVGDDKFGVDFSVIRSRLIKIYFDKENPNALIEINDQASQLISDFIRSSTFTQKAYLFLLNAVTQKGLYLGIDLINEESKLSPSKFLNSKDFSFIKTNFNAIYNFCTETINPFAYFYGLLQDTKAEYILFTQALYYFVNGQIKEFIALLFDPDMPKEHKELINALIILPARQREFGKKLSQGIREKYGLMREFQKQFGIDETNKTDQALIKLHDFTILCQKQDQEGAIDSLLDLSINSDIEEKRNIYGLFFTPQGILKCLANKPVLKQYKIPSAIASEQAIEQRRYLNYVLKFKVDKYSLPIISKAIECIIESTNKLESNPKESAEYLQAAELLYLVELKNYHNLPLEEKNV